MTLRLRIAAFYLKIVISILFYSLHHEALAASYPYAWQLNDEQGLSGNEIYTMLQDSQGFVWLGTNGGLAKYDGNKCLTYAHPEQRSRSFSNLRLDKKGRIWCNNFGGQIFYVENDSLKLFKEWDGFQKGNFPQFEIIGDDIYVSSFNNAIKIYSLITKKWRTLQTDSVSNKSWTLGCGRTEQNNFCYWEITKGPYVVQNNRAIAIPGMNKCGRQYGYFNQSTGKKLFLFDQCGHILEWKNNQFVESPLQKYAGKNHSFILNIHQDSEGDYWLLTQDGVHCYASNGIHRFHFLPGIATYSVMQDREGNTWVSTMGHGVYIIPSKKIAMFDLKIGPKEYSVSHICYDGQGSVYLATRQGKLLIYGVKTIELIDEINLPVLHDVQSMYFDSNDSKLYINIIYTHVFDTKKRGWDNTSLDGSSYKEMQGIKGRIYTAGSSGLSVHHTIKPLQSYKIISNKINSSNENRLANTKLSSERATCVWVDKNGSKILCGFSSGLSLFSENNITKLSYQGKPIIATRIRSLNNGQVYLATVGKGLFEFVNNQIISAKNITEQRIFNIETDGNLLYLLTENGIIVYNPILDESRMINKSAGLVSLSIDDMKIVDSKLFLASNRGVQIIPLNLNFQNKTAPKIYIDNFQANDQKILKSNNIKLSHEQHDISISFFGIGIRSRGLLQFKYRLTGLDTTWTLVGNNIGLARFSSLSSGKYSFEVYAINEDGVQSSQAACISFEIEKPFWETWWFRVLAIIIIATFLYLFYKQRLKRVNKKAAIERNLIESEMKALKSQMNPHFIFNALNSIKAYILTNKPKEAGKYLTKFANLMRAYLELSEQKIIPLSAEIETLKLYLELESLRFHENFSYQINIDPSIEQESFRLPPMLIQPYVENAIKHGLLHQTGEKILSIDFLLKDINTLCCKIEDNGIGRNASSKLKEREKSNHLSFATGATLKRLELLNHHRKNPLLVTYTDLTKGTIVELWIPLL